MPWTVWGAFDKFRKDSVDVLSDVSDRAKASRDYCYAQLRQLAANDDGFPRLSGGFVPYGSFARKTKISPLNDIDFLMLLNGRGTTSNPRGDFEYWLRKSDADAPLALFPDGYGYINSTKILNKVAASLRSIPNYQKAEIKKDMHAVKLNLLSYPWSFDIG